MTDPTPSQRLDKWLWHARFFKTRTLAAKIVSEGKVRIDGTVVSKPARAVQAGMVLTFLQAKDVRIVRVVDFADKRGPAPVAQQLYEDLTPEKPKPDPVTRGANPRFENDKYRQGRPTKKQRRQMDRFDALE